MGVVPLLCHEIRVPVDLDSAHEAALAASGREGAGVVKTASFPTRTGVRIALVGLGVFPDFAFLDFSAAGIGYQPLRNVRPVRRGLRCARSPGNRS